MIPIKQIAWSAGFLEGEGSFVLYKKHSPAVSADQVQRDPLKKLRKLFGGSLGPRSKRSTSNWRVCGASAAALMMTIFPFMSKARQKQIKKALDGWRNGQIATKNRTHCPKGHEYDYFATQNNGKHRLRGCTICRREYNRQYTRKKRAMKPII